MSSSIRAQGKKLSIELRICPAGSPAQPRAAGCLPARACGRTVCAGDCQELIAANVAEARYERARWPLASKKWSFFEAFEKRVT